MSPGAARGRGPPWRPGREAGQGSQGGEWKSTAAVNKGMWLRGDSYSSTGFVSQGAAWKHMWLVCGASACRWMQAEASVRSTGLQGCTPCSRALRMDESSVCYWDAWTAGRALTGVRCSGVVVFVGGAPG